MPWKECKPMDERLRFIARLLEGGACQNFCVRGGFQCREFVNRSPYRIAN
jgi:hypothetical protein